MCAVTGSKIYWGLLLPAARSISYIFPRFRTSMPALKFAHPFFKPDSLQKSPAPY
nr:hypothetical protein [Heyndrickxia coagulans]